jgi:hypothetical protein
MAEPKLAVEADNKKIIIWEEVLEAYTVPKN